MNRIKYILLIGISIPTFYSCVGFFHPELGSSVTKKYVVDGQITDQEGFQTVKVSLTSTLDKTNYSPLSYCIVKIIDNKGNEFKLDEYSRGEYKVWIGKDYLIPGNSYQVKVKTEYGIEIESDLDLMPQCPEIDSIYYILKDLPTTDTYVFRQGIQFYIDIDGKNTNSHFYRWNLTETWEHHAPSAPSNICWTTKEIKEIYNLTTEDLVQNKYTMFPFHFVDNLTQRLNYGYSLLVSQYAISEPAYWYWDKLRINSTKQGGLYSAHPLHIVGNLRSTTNPELEILGFFSASSMKSKRIFVKKVEGLKLIAPVCIPDIGSDGKPNYNTSACLDCSYWDGTTVKPDFWPW